MSILSERLNELCKRKGITGYRLCKDIGMSPNVMTELRGGRRSGLSAKNADKIATYFGVSVGYLLGSEGAGYGGGSGSGAGFGDGSGYGGGADALTMDDFTYAMYEEGKELTEESKRKLIEMAQFFKQHQEKENT